MRQGCVIWLTGLSGSGKTTIADDLAERLRSQHLPVEILDGDDVRRSLSADLGFSAEDRQQHNRRVIYVSKLLIRNGIIVIVPLISPYRETREFARHELGRFIEVFVKCPVEECIRRDPKGLYAKALRGEIANFTGISDPYEEPEHPEVIVETHALSLEACVSRILEAMSERGYMGAGSPHGGTLVHRMVHGEEAERLRQKATLLPSLALDSYSLNDLYMISVGAFSPLRGFMAAKDYHSVLERMRFYNDLVWSLPVTCPVTPEDARKLGRADEIALHDTSGRAVAVLEVEDWYEADPRREAKLVYGTDDEAHPGVAILYNRPSLRVGGRVWAFEDLTPQWFPEDSCEPSVTRTLFQKRRWKTVVGFQTRNPVHRAHEYIQKTALELTDGLLLHPLMGETKAGDIPPVVRMRTYRALLEKYYPQDRVMLSVFPAYMRYAGPREAVFHALVRKNYGCTHFIVGRDHAGVGSYYGPYDAQHIFDQFVSAELGITPLFLENAFYCRACGGMASSKTCPHGAETRVVLSGTQVREMLALGQSPPQEFTRPEVAELLQPGQEPIP